MTIDELLWELRQRQLILISEREIWPSPFCTQDISRALRKHRKGLRVLLAWSSIDTCPARDLHRQYWRYAGAGRFTCDMCRQLLPEGG
jgi:hypothetical protein